MTKIFKTLALSLALCATLISCAPKTAAPEADASTNTQTNNQIQPDESVQKALGVKTYSNKKLKVDFEYSDKLTAVDEELFKADEAALVKLFDDNNLASADIPEILKSTNAIFYDFNDADSIYPSRVSYTNAKNIIFKAIDFNDPVNRESVMDGVYQGAIKDDSTVVVDDSITELEFFGTPYGVLKYSFHNQTKDIDVTVFAAVTLKGSVSHTFLFMCESSKFDADYPKFEQIVSSANFNK